MGDWGAGGMNAGELNMGEGRHGDEIKKTGIHALRPSPSVLSIYPPLTPPGRGTLKYMLSAP
jgi:hypothetical protein